MLLLICILFKFFQIYFQFFCNCLFFKNKTKFRFISDVVFIQSFQYFILQLTLVAKATFLIFFFFQLITIFYFQFTGINTNDLIIHILVNNAKTGTVIYILANTDKLIIILILSLTTYKWQIVKFLVFLKINLK